MITKQATDTYYLTQEQYDTRKNAGTLVEGATYCITDDVEEVTTADIIEATSVEIDSTPTDNSINLVTSGGVKAYVDTHVNASNVTHETWTFTLDDDTTVTKAVCLWI